MRRLAVLLVSALLAVLAALALLLGVQSVRLGWWADTADVALPVLTADQRESDMRHLLDLTARVSHVDEVWRQAGMDNPLDQPEVWVERARSAETNEAFAELVLMYLVHAGQGGHAYLADDLAFDPVRSLVGGIPKEAFARVPLWLDVVAGLPWYAHARLDLVHRGGDYVLPRDATVAGEELPAGTVVRQVDGQDVAAFALAQQYRTHLRFDPQTGGFFIHPLLSIDPGPERAGWRVVFELPDGSTRELEVPKVEGFLPTRPAEAAGPNTTCTPLSGDAVHVRVRTFDGSQLQADIDTLRACLAAATYRTLMIDVRGNPGGEIWAYLDGIVAGLAREPVVYETTAAVKESFFDWYGWRYRLYQATNDNELTDPVARAVDVTRIELPPYSDQGWRVMRVTRRIEPAEEPYAFDGQTFVLADNDTLSAGDSFVSAMRRTGLATVVGANTAGWGSGYQAKMPYALPHSGMLFYLDSELTFNADGSLNNDRGVAPDVPLDPSAYPTPFPETLEPADLRADPWIAWILDQSGDPAP